MALIAAASMPQGDYWAINIDLSKAPKYADTLVQMNANTDRLPLLEQQVGGESLRGRTGGAVTLAVGMAEVFTQAMDRVSGGTISLDAVKKYWYHFAIMFEALFILTTIDAGTRIARFLLQEVLGKDLQAVRSHRLAARRDHFHRRSHSRLGWTDLGRLDRHHLADVRHRQSTAGRDRAGRRHHLAGQQRPRKIRRD